MLICQRKTYKKIFLSIFRIAQDSYVGIPKIPVQPISFHSGNHLLNLLKGGEMVDPKPIKKKVTVRVTVNNIINENDSTSVILALLPAQDHSK